MGRILRQRKLNRLKHYNYSRSGWYFVTISTKDREVFFGNIINRKMIFNNCGLIVRKYWKEITNHYQNVNLDEFVVMPNHIHGVIVVRNNNPFVGNRHACSLQNDNVKRNNQLLFKTIGSYKSASSKFIHQLGFNSFRWQKSFYDHIIRNEKALFAIRQYIRDNPLNWDIDQENPNNLKSRDKKNISGVILQMPPSDRR